MFIFYHEKSAVTLIQRMQHSKNRLCAEMIAALLLERTAGPQPRAVWMLSSVNMGAEKKIVNALETEYVWIRR